MSQSRCRIAFKIDAVLSVSLARAERSSAQVLRCAIVCSRPLNDESCIGT